MIEIIYDVSLQPNASSRDLARSGPSARNPTVAPYSAIIETHLANNQNNYWPSDYFTEKSKL